MKAFLCISALVAVTSAAPQLLRGASSHQSVSKPFQGELRSTAQSKPFGSAVSSVSSHDSVSASSQAGLAPSFLTRGGFGAGHSLAVGGNTGRAVVGAGRLIGGGALISRPAIVGGIGHGVVGHGVIGHGVIGHGVVGHGVAQVYPNEISPYTYQYNVADDYSGSNFQATESDDGNSNRQGSYTVALPDGRVQHVNYHTNDLDGYIAEVTYDGQAAYPEAVARPVVGGAALVSRPVVAGGALGGRPVGVIG